jgi:hypothetical protein
VSADLGSITIVVPRGIDVQVIRHRGGLNSRLDHPVNTSRPPKGVPR